MLSGEEDWHLRKQKPQLPNEVLNVTAGSWVVKETEKVKEEWPWRSLVNDWAGSS